MKNLWRDRLKTISEDGLYLVYKDATDRIGSHFIGGAPVMNYIKKQEAIISAVQDELNSRNHNQEGEINI